MNSVISNCYTLTFEEVQSAIADHDLSTYKGWMAAVRALLKNAPDWVAIKHGDEGYTVALGGDVFALEAKTGGDDSTYDQSSLIDFDSSAWNSELGYWEGSEQALTGDLSSPVFVALKHQ